jgi:hypothetical protein
MGGTNAVDLTLHVGYNGSETCLMNTCIGVNRPCLMLSAVRLSIYTAATPPRAFTSQQTTRTRWLEDHARFHTSKQCRRHATGHVSTQPC